MTRIQQTYRDEDIVFSPDGNRVACVVWKGDLDSNRNIYSLLLFELRSRPAVPTVLVSDAYSPDPLYQQATPISGLRFLSERTVAFLGALKGRRAQVYAVDVETKELRQLTRHPTAVQSFSASSDARVLAFSALAPPDERLREELRQSGFSLWDERVLTPFTADDAYRSVTRPTPEYYWSAREAMAFARFAYGEWYEPRREYFVAGAASSTKPLLEPAAKPMALTLHHGALLTVPDVTVSPTGAHGVLVPFAAVDKESWGRYRYFRDIRNPWVLARVTSLGLVDLRTGRAEPLLDTPIDFYTPPRPVWSPDGSSVVVRSVLPAALDEFDTEPQLLEVDIDSRRVLRIPESAGWQPVLWNTGGSSLVLRQGSSLGVTVKRGGEWQAITPLAARADTGLNPRYGVATNGAVVVGVMDSPTTAPELALYDVASKRTTVLTDLNPELRQRQYGAVEKIFWPGPASDTASGDLVKPVGFVEGKRYPLVVLLKGGSDASDESYIIDGQVQLSGWAIQTFAARGLMVLLAPAPPSLREVDDTPGEGPRVMANVENAIRYLDERKLIDTRKVGISGWSRNGYRTDYILTHSSFDFAAATDIDGGGNYIDFHQRWGASPEERDSRGRFQLDVSRVRTPLLSEQHSPSALIGQGEFIMALHVLGKPVDLYYYPGAPHAVKAPLHRLHSLRTHVDWFRFWLQDYEDPDSTKKEQYTRWRRLKALQSRSPADRR